MRRNLSRRTVLPHESENYLVLDQKSFRLSCIHCPIRIITCRSRDVSVSVTSGKAGCLPPKNLCVVHSIDWFEDDLEAPSSAINK
jgi:hypothetical protein